MCLIQRSVELNVHKKREVALADEMPLFSYEVFETQGFRRSKYFATVVFSLKGIHL